MSNLSDKIYTDYLKKDFAFLRNSKKISLVKDIIEESKMYSKYNFSIFEYNLGFDINCFCNYFFVFYFHIRNTIFINIFFYNGNNLLLLCKKTYKIGSFKI